MSLKNDVKQVKNQALSQLASMRDEPGSGSIYFHSTRARVGTSSKRPF